MVHRKHVNFDEQSFSAATSVQQYYQNVNVVILKGTCDEQELFGSPDQEYETAPTDNEDEEITSARGEEGLIEQLYAIASHEEVRESSNGLLTEDNKQTEEDDSPRLRYSRRDRRSPVRFSINTLPGCRGENERTAKETNAENASEKWTAAMSTEIRALNDLDYWKEVHRPRNEHVFHKKFICRRKSNQKDEVEKYKARLVLRGNEEYVNDYGSFSPLSV